MATDPRDQLSLFPGMGPAQPQPARRGPDPLEAPPLPEGVRLGTSSWTFDGWRGLVYHRPYKNKQSFTRDSLAEYAAHPLFGTVGIDASYYNPLSAEQLAHYASQLPAGFRCLEKVWDAITVPVWPAHPRYGDRAGQPNPGFLDPQLFIDAVYEPNRAAFADHLGPLLFEFSPLRPEERPAPDAFADRLDAFFSALPQGPMYAVELRNRELFTPRYLDVLRAHGVIHVLNLWSWMPSPGRQRRMGDVFTGPAMVSRLMIGPGHRYADRVAAWSPFDHLHQVDGAHRQEVVELVMEALRRALPVYIIINNKFEGCSPLSVKGLAQEIAAALKEEDVP